MSFYENQNATQGQSQDGALSWDSPIEKESNFEIFPEGTYQYIVIDLERDTFPGSENLSACPSANLTLRVKNVDTGEEGEISRISLLLHSKMEWLLSAFFLSIGQKKPGEPLQPDWGKVVGSRGLCELEVVKSTSKKDGKEYTNNRVKKWLPPQEKAAAPPAKEEPTPTQQGFDAW